MVSCAGIQYEPADIQPRGHVLAASHVVEPKHARRTEDGSQQLLPRRWSLVAFEEYHLARDTDRAARGYGFDDTRVFGKADVGTRARMFLAEGCQGWNERRDYRQTSRSCI